MQPQLSKVTIENNKDLIKELLADLVINPRLKLIKWSKITHQTPNIKIGYPGQHLSSLITGVEGDRSGARGHDLRDGSEVKSCSRVDQLDKCKACKFPVARLESMCSNCESVSIKRNNDSKWLFSVRSPEEVAQLTNQLDRIVLMISDYPNFDDCDYETLRFQAFEIWPKHARGKRFVELIKNYYEKIYLEHKRKDPKSNPAPKNFWPYQYQFYMCNPIKTFSCTVKNSTTDPQITIDALVDPTIDRVNLLSELMPANILSGAEMEHLSQVATDKELDEVLLPGKTPASFRALSNTERVNSIAGVTESLRNHLPLRDTDKISVASTAYTRRDIS